MAYMDFTLPLAAAGNGTALPVVADRIAAATGGLNRQEWQIVALARDDGLASLRDGRGWFSLRELIFGRQPRSKLASGRLESLRRIAVDAWHHGFAVHPSSITDFRAAGFSEGQLETLLTAISAARHNRD